MIHEREEFSAILESGLYLFLVCGGSTSTAFVQNLGLLFDIWDLC